jgi:nucleoside 2-deoxyribosyltransferase
MIEIKAPSASFDTVFLAGSIEMGKAEKWQDKLANDLKNENVMLFNPRRDDWDSSWIQDPTPGTQFHQQVNWELDHIRKADMVVFYFDPATQSPITLMELGYCIGTKMKIVVCCPKEYFRHGNVVIMCRLLGVTPVETYDEFLAKIRDKLGIKVSAPVVADIIP